MSLFQTNHFSYFKWFYDSGSDNMKFDSVSEIAIKTMASLNSITTPFVKLHHVFRQMSHSHSVCIYMSLSMLGSLYCNWVQNLLKMGSWGENLWPENLNKMVSFLLNLAMLTWYIGLSTTKPCIFHRHTYYSKYMNSQSFDRRDGLVLIIHMSVKRMDTYTNSSDGQI